MKQLMRPLLPRAVRRIYRSIVPKGPEECAYAYSPDHSVVNDFAEFSRESVDTVSQRIRGFQLAVCSEWSAMGLPKFAEAADKFYASSSSYVYDLLSANYSLAAVREKLDTGTPRILDAIRRHPGTRFLEFGGGVGVVCELVAGMGKNVTYLDIPGRISEFARWRFAKYQIPLRAEIVEPGHLDGLEQQDIIFSDAVLEHLPPAEQLRTLRILAKQLSPGGMLALLVDISGKSKANPTHAQVDIHGLHDILRNENLNCTIGENNVCSIWKNADVVAGSDEVAKRDRSSLIQP